MDYIAKILDFLKGLGVDCISSIVSLCTKIVDFLAVRQNKKIQDEEQKKIESAEDKVDSACNSGSISDLIDATIELGKTRK